METFASRRVRRTLLVVVSGLLVCCHGGFVRPDACHNVTCSEHGECAVLDDSRAVCLCDDGYRQEGLECLPEGGDADADADNDADADADNDADADADNDADDDADDSGADADDDACVPATERCNGVDDDCDGEIDEEGAEGELSFFIDADGDGFGTPENERRFCSPPPGWTERGGDCDDGDARIHPGASEECDAIDNDCDGVFDAGECFGCAVLGHDTSTYLFCSSAPASWENARDACFLDGYHLVVVNGATENDWIWRIAAGISLEDWWLGLSYDFRDAAWRWVDASTVSFTAWRDGAPNLGTDEPLCAELDSDYSGLWDDTPCRQLQPFVCELEHPTE